MGGTRWPGINLPSNLLTLCGSGTTGCHGWVEHHPTWAKAHGWSISQHGRHLFSTVSVAVWTWRGWGFLRDDGTWLPRLDHPGVEGCTCGCRPLETTTGVWDTPTTEGNRT